MQDVSSFAMQSFSYFTAFELEGSSPCMQEESLILQPSLSFPLSQTTNLLIIHLY